MRTKRFVYLCITLLFPCISLWAQKKEYKVINIGFYNLENFFDTVHQKNVDDFEFLPDGKKGYTGKVYLDKVKNMASVVGDIGKQFSPDGLAILGVAEIENESVLKDMISAGKLPYSIVHYNSPDKRGIDVALLYNPKYFEVISSQPLTVHLPDGWPTRDVLWVTGKLDGEVYHIFVNHWPSRRNGEAASAPGRAIAAGVSRHIMDSLFRIDPNSNVILMGDLNDNPTNESMTKVLKAKGDVEKLKKDELFNPWVAFYKKGIGTLAYQDAWALFDQIVLSQHVLDKNDDHYHFYKANIFKRDDMVQSSGKYQGYPKRTFDFDNYVGGFSDHFPTFITLIKAN